MGRNVVDRRADLVAVRGLTKVYDRGTVQALRGVDFVVHPGEVVAIIGPSGSGKSTLLNLLGGLDRPTSGELLFDGVPLAAGRDTDRFRATRVGFVFQTFQLLPTLTAVQNVQIPMFEVERAPGRRRAKAEALLRLVGLPHRMRHLPAQLSVGERQRVAIARALANDPALILADEPTGSLDSRAAAEVTELLGTVNRQRGTTIVIITHDPDVAASAHRVIQMRDGRIVAGNAA